MSDNREMFLSGGTSTTVIEGSECRPSTLGNKAGLSVQQISLQRDTATLILHNGLRLQPAIVPLTSLSVCAASVCYTKLHILWEGEGARKGSISKEKACIIEVLWAGFMSITCINAARKHDIGTMETNFTNWPGDRYISLKFHIYIY